MYRRAIYALNAGQVVKVKEQKLIGFTNPAVPKCLKSCCSSRFTAQLCSAICLKRLRGGIY
jgi:hypothetical protein